MFNNSNKFNGLLGPFIRHVLIGTVEYFLSETLIEVVETEIKKCRDMILAELNGGNEDN